MTINEFSGPHDLQLNDIHVALTVPSGAALNGQVLYCLPGGGMSAKYFDLGGAEQPDFSFARYFAARGFVVAAIDPVGVGASKGPEDSYALFPKQIVAQYISTVKDLQAGFSAGSLHSSLPAFKPAKEIGVAHSMGAALTVMAQAGSNIFDRLVLLGYGTKGLPDMMDEEEKTVIGDPEKTLERLPEFARKRFRGVQYPKIPDGHHDPSPTTDILKEAAGELLPLPAVFSMIPGNISRETAQIKCPIFLAVGDRDMAGPPRELPSEYPSSSDISLYVIENCGHHGFVADARGAFFAKVDGWLNSFE